MGGTKQYLSEGGFSEYKYKTVEILPNGAKVVQKKESDNNSLPSYSNTPYTYYAVADNEGIKQITYYGGGKDGRRKTKDIDWRHGHGKFKAGEIHVHLYENGVKTTYYRKPSKKEKRVVMTSIYRR